MSTGEKPRDDSERPDSRMDRRRFLQGATTLGVTIAFGHRVDREAEAAPVLPRVELSRAKPPEQESFELNEITVRALQRAMIEKRYTARSVVELYKRRIELLDHADPGLHSVIELNPDALTIADTLDAERRAGKVRGPLHGVPVLLKDVVDTADRMRTTAGSLALTRSFAVRDAFIATRLRAAGAIILGKTNLSEWSNARSPHATSGWSARGGLTKNGYVLDRTACGSSAGSGVAIAANFATIGIGVETDGSIACPASANSLVGIKPTVGLCSRSGLIPVTYAFDTPGPLARTVTDAAILLGVLTGVDPRDPATTASTGRALTDYTVGLAKGALKGARIGVLRRDLTENSLVTPVFAEALKAVRAAGAVLIDDVKLPTFDEIQIPKAIVQICELKDSMKEYLRQRGPTESHKSLADLIRFNEQNARQEMQYFGQEIFETAEGSRGREAPEYLTALERSQTFTRAVLDRAFNEMRLDAIVSLAADVPFTTDLLNGDHPMVRNSFLSAVAGYPRVTVPAGFVYGLPVGISFIGNAWSEARLIRLAYDFEQLVHARRAPRFLPTANLDRP